MQILDFTQENKSVWDASLSHQIVQAPFFSFEWHQTWYETLGKNYTPLVLLSHNCIAPLAQKNDTVIFSGGYEIADYLDILGSEENKVLAWQEISTYLKSNSISKIELRNIPENSATRTFFKDKTEITYEDTTPYITLPATWDEYLQMLDRKDRHELKRKIRKYENTFAQSEVVESKNIENDIKELFRLMKLNPAKDAFLNSDMESFFIMLTDKFSDTCSLLLLKTNNMIAGATLALKNKSTIFLYNSGFDEQNFSGGGLYLKVKGIQKAIEDKITEFNFLQGQERYKYELGGKDFGVYSLTYLLS